MNRLQQALLTSVDLARWAGRRALSPLRRPKLPVHVLFCTVDHFEPGTGRVAEDVERDRVARLLRDYPRLASPHGDADGVKPRRTWFFPPHYHRFDSLRRLVALCKQGWGEIELHLHHGKTRPDRPENLQRTILCCLDEYSRFGIFGRKNGEIRYGFIHGDWALCNSRGGRFCGIDNEIDILLQTGCYADFTFPSPSEANPAWINTIYYASNGTAERNGLHCGQRVRRSAGPRSGLMIIQGPRHPFFKDRRLSSLRLLGDVIDVNVPLTPRRVDAWVRTGVHVAGKPEWVIVKTHTHGAVNSNVDLGPKMDAVFDHLETRYNDGTRYVLHYVSARELYNIVKAVEAGEEGDDPHRCRDYLVSSPRYDDSPCIPEASKSLRNLVGYSYSNSP